ncbi:NUDIX hydrolase [Salisediminibacterium halotolerans]|uniref:NUDIX hydrolase n=1 Tax=Salisediminibacterium halotolerans TaxID=517425 RepID=UPI000EAE9E97|nr:NUDIX hydrolase [Salisediminibacterium halotolerans]RLJ78010.1 ADP-ribose pyrophosphatase [Actinophytocola xinjiangensis]RPE88652.1 ADP-ribose pyrophosphatase [Salisediminibacterium halotolerans]TWG36987.1 ADP-ribose pyrophosphatase [Salisediminibacterium halotolerans]GEL08478.1 ADP-ribose pyrophosphatase [Salisediminibacterium halotolerans]
MKSNREETKSREIIFNGSLIDVEVQEVYLPDGNTSRRELVYHPGAVAVIAFTEEGKLILVKQYRKALQKAIAEIPAGKLENKESPEKCAIRELEEETGLRAASMTKLLSFYTSPGFADEIVHLFLADSLTAGDSGTDDDEFVERVDVTFEEAKRMIENGEIHDAKTAYAVQYWELLQTRSK